MAFEIYSEPTMTAPRFVHWEDFLARATGPEIRQMCHARTKKANAARLSSAAPERKLTARDVWDVLASARGRCVHCGSFCVERLPYAGPVKLPWEHIGRRIGTVEHMRSRVTGGGNERENLGWACLWCNTWPNERRQGADDHGGLFPPDDGDRSALPPPWRTRERTDYGDELADAYGFIEEDDPTARNWL